MFRSIGYALAIGVGAGGVAAADPIAVNDVDVQVDLDAAAYNALDYWPQIESDLEAAIAAKAASLPGEVPYDVAVNIESISLNGSGLLTGEGEFNHMGGWVRAYPVGSPAAARAWPIALVASTEAPTFTGPDVILIPPAESEFYVALVDAFASAAIETLGNIDSDEVVPGSPTASSEPSLDSGEAGAGADAGTDAGTDAAAGTETDAGTEAGADAGTETDTGADTGAGTDTGSGGTTTTGEADAGAEVDASAGTESGGGETDATGGTTGGASATGN